MTFKCDTILQGRTLFVICMWAQNLPKEKVYKQNKHVMKQLPWYKHKSKKPMLLKVWAKLDL